MAEQSDQENVNLNEFAKMVGFPTELIKKELFNNDVDSNELSIEDLRDAMLKYIDNTMMKD